MTDPACRLCGYEQVHEKFFVRGFHIMECARCGFVQVAEAPENHNADIYDQKYFSHSKYQDPAILKKENQRRLALLQQALPNYPARVLDAGCGVGDFVAEAAANTKAEVFGVDIAESAIDIAKQSHPHMADRFYAGLLETQDFPPESFDVICSWDVIEHIWDPAETYQRLYDFLAPGGALLISTPNIGAPLAKVLGRYWAFMTPPEHLSFFSKRSMTLLAQDILHGKLTRWFSRGKWTNLGFLVYKANRVLPSKPLAALRDWLHHSFFGKISIYVPTGDIQYAVIYKPKSAWPQDQALNQR